MGKVSCYETILESPGWTCNPGRRRQTAAWLDDPDLRGWVASLTKLTGSPLSQSSVPAKPSVRSKWHKAKKQHLKTHLANRCVIFIKIKHRCSQTRLELWWCGAKMLSAVLGEGAWGCPLAPGVPSTSMEAHCKTHAEHYFYFFLVKLK